MINWMAYLSNYKKIVLTQKVIDIIDAACLRIFNRNHTIFNLTGGDRAEDISKATIRYGFWMNGGRNIATIGIDGLFSKCAWFSLEGETCHLWSTWLLSTILFG